MTGRRSVPTAEALWRSSRKGLVLLAGGALVLGGLAMLVLPGPGILVIIAGLSLLAREFVWAERALKAARRKAAAGAERVKQSTRRRSSAPAPTDVVAAIPAEAAEDPGLEAPARVDHLG